MARRGEAEFKFKGNDKDYQKKIKAMQKSNKKLQDSLFGMVKNISRFMIGATVAIGGAVVEFAKFEVAMLKTKFVAGATGAEFKALSKQARELGKSTSKTATEAAEAQLALARAGLKVNEIMGAMPSTLALAESAQIGIAESATYVSSTIKQFGIEAGNTERIVDAFTKGANIANTDVPLLANALQYAAGGATSLSIELEDTIAALGLVSDIVGSDKAGRSLNAFFAGVKKNADDLKAFNINVYDSAGNTRELVDIMRDFENATNGLSDAKKNAILATVGDINAQRAANALLTQGTDALEANAKAIRAAKGITEEFANVIRNTLEGRFAIMQSAITEVGLVIAENLLPHVIDLIDGVTSLANRFNALSNEQKAKLIGTLVSVAKALSAVVVASGALIAMLKLKMVYLKLAALSWRGMWAAATGGLTLLIPLLAGFFTYFYNSSESFKATVNGIGAVVKEVFSGIVETFNATKNAISGFLDKIAPNRNKASDSAPLESSATIDSGTEQTAEFSASGGGTIEPPDASEYLSAVKENAETEIDINASKIQTIEEQNEAHRLRMLETETALKEQLALDKELQDEAKIEALETQIAEDELDKERKEKIYKENIERRKRLLVAEENFGKAGVAIEKFYSAEKYQTAKGNVDSLAQLQGSGNERMFKIGKAAAIAQILLETPQAIMAAFTRGGGFPWGLIPASVTGILANERLQQVKASQPAKFFDGSFSVPSVMGGTGKDAIPAMVSQGEFIASSAGGEADAARNNAVARQIAARDAGFGDDDEAGDGSSGNVVVNITTMLDGETIALNQQEVRARLGI